MSPVLIIDTNVVVAGLIGGNAASPTAKLLDGMLAGQLRFLLSADLIREYREVLHRPRLQKLHGLTQEDTDLFLEGLVVNAIFRDPVGIECLEPAPDPDDNHLWQLLAAWPGSILVTGDKLLLQRPPIFAGVLSPAGACTLLWGGQPP